MGYGRLTLFLAGVVAIVVVAFATSPAPDRTYAKHFAPGEYRCGRCGNSLFDSGAKFDSGTRWPSFRASVAEAVVTRPDLSGGMRRTEVLCASCELHLGHVFTDGRTTGDTHSDAGLRYCILSSSLEFVPRDPHSTSE